MSEVTDLGGHGQSLRPIIDVFIILSPEQIVHPLERLCNIAKMQQSPPHTSLQSKRKQMQKELTRTLAPVT
jgi:hypothetical protein